MVPVAVVTRQPSVKATLSSTMIDAVTPAIEESSPPISKAAKPPGKKKPKRGDRSGPESKDPAAPKKDEKDKASDIATPATVSSDNNQETVEIVEEGDSSGIVEWKPLTPAFKVIFALTGLLVFTMIVALRNCLIKRALIAKAESMKPEYDQLLPKSGGERDIETGSSGADEQWDEDWEEDDEGGIHAGRFDGNSDPSTMSLIKPGFDNSKDLQTSPSSSFSYPISSLAPGYSLVGKAAGRSVSGSSSNSSIAGSGMKRSGSNEVELSKPLAAITSTATERTSFKDQTHSSRSSSEFKSSDSSPHLFSTTMASSSSHFAGTKVNSMKGGLALGSREGEDLKGTQVTPAKMFKIPPPSVLDTDFFAVSTFANILLSHRFHVPSRS